MLDDDALVLISQQAGGSLRDALGILDQVRAFAGETISAEDVRSSIGLGRPEVVGNISEAIVSNDPGAALRLIRDATDQGIDPTTLLRQLIEYWRATCVCVAGSGFDENLDPLLAEIAADHAKRLRGSQVLLVLRALAEEIVEPRLSVSPELPLEIAVTQAVISVHENTVNGETSAGPLPDQPAASGRSVRERPAADIGGAASEDVAPKDASVAEPGSVTVELAGLTETAEPNGCGPETQIGTPTAPDSDDLSAHVNEVWPLVVQTMGGRSKTVQALLRDVVQKSVVGDEVSLGFRYPLHRDRLDKPENRAMLAAIIKEIVGTPLKIRCIVTGVVAGEQTADDADSFVAEAERRLRGVHAQEYRSGRTDGSNVSKAEGLVGETGFEPATPCTPCKCATGLRHSPIFRPSGPSRQQYLVPLPVILCHPCGPNRFLATSSTGPRFAWPPAQSAHGSVSRPRRCRRPGRIPTP